MLLVNLQLVTTSTAVDDFQPVIEVAETNKHKYLKKQYWIHNSYTNCEQ